MPEFGTRSRAVRKTLRKELQDTFDMAIQILDFSLIEGHRNEVDQNDAYDKKRSKVQWPDSKHNDDPSSAGDAIPYPFQQSDWNNRERFVQLAWVVITCGWFLGHKIRWGGDWDMDTDMKDQSFNDLPHFEYIGSTTSMPVYPA